MIELHIEKSPFRNDTSFWIMLGEGKQRYIIGYKDGFIVKQEYNPTVVHTDLLPMLVLETPLADAFIEQIAIYAGQKWIRTENENLLKGKLDATERHLMSTQTNFDKLLTAYISDANHIGENKL